PRGKLSAVRGGNVQQALKEGRMLYQLRFSAAIHRTALVLLLVCVSSVLGMAGPKNISLTPKCEPKVPTFVEQAPATVAQQKLSPSPSSTPRPNVSIAPAKKIGRAHV